MAFLPKGARALVPLAFRGVAMRQHATSTSKSIQSRSLLPFQQQQQQQQQFTNRKNMATRSATTEASAETDKPAAAPKKVQTKRTLSGVQPTGSIHLGNYLGAIKQWVENQDTEERDEDGTIVPREQFYMIVDMHAITMPHDPAELAENSYKSAALYIAAGTFTICVVNLCV